MEMETPGKIEFISSQIVSHFSLFFFGRYIFVLFLVSPQFYAPVRSFSLSVIYFYVASMERRWNEDVRKREGDFILLLDYVIYLFPSYSQTLGMKITIGNKI